MVYRNIVYKLYIAIFNLRARILINSRSIARRGAGRPRCVRTCTRFYAKGEISNGSGSHFTMEENTVCARYVRVAVPVSIRLSNGVLKIMHLSMLGPPPPQ